MATRARPKAKAAKIENQPTQHPLLPLEYCRPERAAKLLNCEIEDLFHWAAIGAIKIYVNAARAMDGIKTVGVHLPKDVPPTFVIEPDDLAGEFKFGAAFNFIRVGKIGSPGYELSNEGYCTFKVSKLSGFWAIANFDLWHWEQGGGIPESDEYKLAIFSSFDSSEQAYLPDKDKSDIDITLEVIASFPSLTDNLWLMREDLEKLHQHIHTGQPFPIRENDRKQRRNTMRRVLGLKPLQIEIALETQQPSPVSVSWDNARAGILAASLHVIAKQHPDIFKTTGLLAEDALKHAEDIREMEGGGGHKFKPEGAQSLIDQAIEDGRVFIN